MHVWTMACGQAFPTTSGRPFSPSQTTKNTSLTPLFFRSVSTLIQNLARSRENQFGHADPGSTLLLKTVRRAGADFMAVGGCLRWEVALMAGHR
jgi:hypothetical protein